MTVSSLRTERLLLRAPLDSDAPTIATALNNYEISKWLTLVPFPYTVADAEWFINENKKGRFHVRLLWSGDQFIGVMGIDGELGYWLDQSAWGHGFATEAGRAVIGDYFATQKPEILRSSYFDENASSRNVLTKLGFVETGSQLHYSKTRAEDVPGRFVELTREQHYALRRAQQ